MKPIPILDINIDDRSLPAILQGCAMRSYGFNSCRQYQHKLSYYTIQLLYLRVSSLFYFITFLLLGFKRHHFTAIFKFYFTRCHDLLITSPRYCCSCVSYSSSPSPTSFASSPSPFLFSDDPINPTHM
jgi:hypothetical protein